MVFIRPLGICGFYIPQAQFFLTDFVFKLNYVHIFTFSLFLCFFRTIVSVILLKLILCSSKNWCLLKQNK